jgi:NAD(P)H-hydrate epimerase
VDLPSGIGEAREPDAFVADFTYIPGVPKGPALETGNTDFTGRIRFLEIDPFKRADKAEEQGLGLVSPHYFRRLRGLRSATSDKRTFGHCIVLGGSREMPGALMMSVLGSLHAGAGLVTAAFPTSMAERVAGTIPEAMWRPLPVKSGGGFDVEAVRLVSQLVSRADALLIGPGMVMDRATTFAVCRIVRECKLPVVVDASALTQDVLAAVVGRPLTAGPVILTPHWGEFNRISGIRFDDISDASICEFSRKYRLLTILKGSPNRITDGNRTFILPAGGPVLARGGSGDILSGMLVTLLAQMPEEPLEAALNAVSWHGAAADALAREKGSVAVRTTEILPYLGKTLR